MVQPFLKYKNAEIRVESNQDSVFPEGNFKQLSIARVWAKVWGFENIVTLLPKPIGQLPARTTVD